MSVRRAARSPLARLRAPLFRALILASGVCALAARPLGAQEYRQVHMGMEVRLALHGVRAPAQADAIADRVYARIAVLEAVLSDWRADSELRRLSDAPVDTWVPVSPPLRDVLARALDISRATDGAFDPTVGALTALWREAARTGRAIPDTARDRARRAVDARAVELDTLGARVRLRRAGMRLDLGGIAKGWILADALRLVAPEEASGVLLEAGGDLVVRGAPDESSSPSHGRRGYRVVVPTARVDTVLVLEAGAVSTSSTRAQLAPGARGDEGHVILPRTGRGTSDTPQLTVVGPDAAVTDALATALPLLPRARWAALAARYGVTIIEGPPPGTR